jgi:hypothetical protein
VTDVTSLVDLSDFGGTRIRWSKVLSNAVKTSNTTIGQLGWMINQIYLTATADDLSNRQFALRRFVPNEL